MKKVIVKVRISVRSFTVAKKIGVNGWHKLQQKKKYGLASAALNLKFIVVH